MLRKTWRQFHDDVAVLIRNMGCYRPEILAPLLRGGAAPMLYVSQALGIKDVRPINVLRDGMARRIIYPPDGNLGDIVGRNVLLLEDDVPSGGSLMYVRRVLEDRGALVRAAAVYVMPSTASHVDYFARVRDSLPGLPWKSPHASRDQEEIIGGV